MHNLTVLLTCFTVLFRLWVFARSVVFMLLLVAYFNLLGLCVIFIFISCMCSLVGNVVYYVCELRCFSHNKNQSIIDRVIVLQKTVF